MEVSWLAHICLICVSQRSNVCLIFVLLDAIGLQTIHKVDGCLRREFSQSHYPRGPQLLCAVRCQTKENTFPPQKPQEIKEMLSPEGCVLCGGLKGPGAAPGAGDFKGTCERPGDAHEVRRTAPPAQPVGLDAPIQNRSSSKAKGRPRAAFCFGACCGG